MKNENLNTTTPADENRERCKAIADQLETIMHGDLCRCPMCGEIVSPENIGDYDGEPWGDCPECGAGFALDECTVSVADYIAETALDVEYRCNINWAYKSVKICVAFGGPSIYIDTATRSVELHWWTERASYLLSDEAVAEIDAYAEEMWECGRGCR